MSTGCWTSPAVCTSIKGVNGRGIEISGCGFAERIAQGKKERKEDTHNGLDLDRIGDDLGVSLGEPSEE